MKFKEKLSLLRTQMKLSQEDLANKLNISRQSVTKWENGQSYPDVQNLIQLSDIFKVSIDRLVKENDTCNLSLLETSRYSKQDLRLFIVRAKNSTYISSENVALSSRPNSTDYQYCENDFLYIDTYIGNEKFIGEEAVWLKEIPVYGMNYYGHIMGEYFDINFLKEALSYVTVEYPFRGPEFYQRGDYTYNCKINGDVEHFYGEEFIYCKQKKVYFCTFHGGTVL